MFDPFFWNFILKEISNLGCKDVPAVAMFWRETTFRVSSNQREYESGPFIIVTQVMLYIYLRVTFAICNMLVGLRDICETVSTNMYTVRSCNKKQGNQHSQTLYRVP